MARPLRVQYPGAVYHLTSRGNERKDVFKDDQDRQNFLDTLARTSSRYNWVCHAYCLMINHYHLLIETLSGNLALGMRQLNGVYTQAFNRRHGRTGHLFQGRYKAILIQKESHLLEVCRYVVLNPVGAGIVGRPDSWPWSSYRGTAGKAKAHRCLTSDWILSQFGKRRLEAQREYRSFVKAGIGQETIWKNVKGQSLLGDETFKAQLFKYLKGHETIPEIPKSQRFLHRPELGEIFTGAILLDRKERDEKIVEAVEKHGYRQRELADHLGMHFTSISRIVNWRARGLLRK